MYNCSCHLLALIRGSEPWDWGWGRASMVGWVSRALLWRGLLVIGAPTQGRGSPPSVTRGFTTHRLCPGDPCLGKWFLTQQFLIFWVSISATKTMLPLQNVFTYGSSIIRGSLQKGIYIHIQIYIPGVPENIYTFYDLLSMLKQ